MTDALAHAEPRQRQTERRRRSPHGLGMYVTDVELVELLGVPADVAMRTIRMLDRDKGQRFPQKQKLWGDRRYLPAVEAWFDAHYGLKMAVPRRTRP